MATHDLTNGFHHEIFVNVYAGRHVLSFSSLTGPFLLVALTWGSF